MYSILKEHYLMFCDSEFNREKFTDWTLTLDADDLMIIMVQTPDGQSLLYGDEQE